MTKTTLSPTVQTTSASTTAETLQAARDEIQILHSQMDSKSEVLDIMLAAYGELSERVERLEKFL